MKIKFFTLCASVLLFAGVANAQNYAFKVFGSKGSNTVNGTPIKVGAKLEETQSVVVGEGAYLGLANSNGKTVELTSKGTYKVKDLIAKATSSSSLTSKYASFVINEITKEDEDAAANNRSRHMNKTGSVTRGNDGLVAVMLPMKSQIFGTTTVIKWYVNDAAKEKEIKNYRVVITDMSDDVLYSQDVDKTELAIDLNRKELANQQHMIFKVIPLNKEGKALDQEENGYAVLRLKADELKKVGSEYSAFKDQAEANAIAKLIEARFFEDKELYLDAIAAYEEAIKLAPETARYKQMYEDFLYRNVLSKEARNAAVSAVNAPSTDN